MCGIFGFYGKKGKTMNPLKMKILGVYNTERGTDSCGYFYSGFLEKGINKYSDFKDFIADVNSFQRGEMETEIFIGHTRNSTIGSNSYENAHPHLVNDRYVQTHNGTLGGWVSLCNNHDVETNDVFVDSMGLAKIIEKDGFNVLDEYEGFAALAMTFLDVENPSLYLFKGGSKSKKGSDELIEERPIFLLHEPEGIYYSSMWNSLEAIKSDENAVVMTITPNCVIEINDGISVKNIFQVTREGKNKPVEVIKTYSNNHSRSNHTNTKNSLFKSSNDKTYSQFSKFLGNGASQSKQIEGGNEDIVYYEEFPKVVGNTYGESPILFVKGRYYNKNQELLNGPYFIDSKGVILKEEIALVAKDISINKEWFNSGVLLKSEEAYNNLKDLGFLLRTPTAEQLSNVSDQPVIAEKEQAKKIDGSKVKWCKNGSPIKRKCSFQPKYSKSLYRISQYGTTRKITLIH